MAILFLRALLTSTALVVAALPAIVVVGAFAPDLPTVARFGALLAGDLPWLWLGSGAAGGIALAGVVLGGGRPARVVLAAALVVFGAYIVIMVVLWVFAGREGGTYSPLRQLQAAPNAPTADRQVVVAALEDGTTLLASVWEGAPAEATRAGGALSVDPAMEGTAIVYVHGGGFIGGGLGSRPHLFAFFASRGITVIDVEYRLAPPPRWSDAPGDVLCALVWVGAHAEDLGVDPARVVVAGESAGGSLALLAGYAAGTDLLSPSCPGEPVVPAGVMAIAPAADLAGIWADRTLTHEGRPFPETYVGGPPSEFPDRYDLASPGRLLRPGLPPTLLIAGANDHLVRLARVASIHDGITAAGSQSRLVIVPFADHGFDGFPNGFGAQLEENVLPAFVAEVTR